MGRNYVPADESLPALHRAHRLSYAIWSVLSDESDNSYMVKDDEFGDVQPALEATSTSERLRLALLRMREISKNLEL